MTGVKYNLPLYMVHWVVEKHTRLRDAFEGEGAFTKANELFEQKKADPRTIKISMRRYDGSKTEYVVRELTRDESGNWLPEQVRPE